MRSVFEGCADAGRLQHDMAINPRRLCSRSWSLSWIHHVLEAVALENSAGLAQPMAMQCDGSHSLVALWSCESRTVHNKIYHLQPAYGTALGRDWDLRCWAELPFKAVPINANANHLRWSIASNNFLFTPRAATQELKGEVGRSAIPLVGSRALWPLLSGNLMKTARNDKRKRKARCQTRHQKLEQSRA